MDNGLIHFGMFSYYSLANQKMHTCVLTIIHVSREHLSLSNVLKNEPQKGRREVFLPSHFVRVVDAEDTSRDQKRNKDLMPLARN